MHRGGALALWTLGCKAVGDETRNCCPRLSSTIPSQEDAENLTELSLQTKRAQHDKRVRSKASVELNAYQCLDYAWLRRFRLLHQLRHGASLRSLSDTLQLNNSDCKTGALANLARAFMPPSFQSSLGTCQSSPLLSTRTLFAKPAHFGREGNAHLMRHKGLQGHMTMCCTVPAHTHHAVRAAAQFALNLRPCKTSSKQKEPPEQAWRPGNAAKGRETSKRSATTCKSHAKEVRSQLWMVFQVL